MEDRKNNQIIKEMYHGEENRDASSKIRGFLFQDLVAISKLLDEKTVYVIPEYIEDVFVYTEDKTAYVIQAKYYPKGDIKGKHKDIIRDLYYQYLRLEVKKYTEKVIPVLAVYSLNNITKPALSILQGEDYINVNREEKPADIENPEKWLEDNVYSEKKNDAATKLFEKFAYNESMRKFLEAYKIDPEYKEIEQYRKDIGDQLSTIQIDGCVIEGEKRKLILLGLAIQYIQKRYDETMEGEENFEKRKCKRTEFIEYLRQKMCTETEETIGAYLRLIVIECWEQIQNGSDLVDEKVSDMLECIRDYTAQWLFELGSNVQGQRQLLNTVSSQNQSKLENFCEMPITRRREIICEHYDSINDFLKYLWKIMIDINIEILSQEIETTDEQRKRLMPQTYINSYEKNYISLKFPGDNVVDGVILANILGGSTKTKMTAIFGRMKEFQPQKWYMEAGYRGKYLYTMNISDIKNLDKEGYEVTATDPNKFEIECMECIDVDMDGWNKIEKCNECIFDHKCVKLKEKKE